jgi:hypothetical protein
LFGEEAGDEAGVAEWEGRYYDGFCVRPEGRDQNSWFMSNIFIIRVKHVIALKLLLFFLDPSNTQIHVINHI